MSILMVMGLVGAGWVPVAQWEAGPESGLAGLVECEGFVVPAGKTVWVEGNLEIRCSGPVEIDGMLRVRSQGAGAGDAFDVVIRSESSIRIDGVLMGGRGGDAFLGSVDMLNCTTRGGAGTDWFLEAPELVVQGSVHAGPGGRSGPNAAGGGGGHVHVRADRCVQELKLRGDKGSRTGFFGGRGGGHLSVSFTHAIPAGSGGPGGSVVVLPWNRSLSDWTPWMPARAACMLLLCDDERRGRPQNRGEEEGARGSNGKHGVSMTGGPGAPGAPGAHGELGSPQGQTGGVGGPGGKATGTHGQPGGFGADACPSGIGGPGGNGGKGGDAIGGLGGPGGAGGNGLFDVQQQAFVAPGGVGGNGGIGGSATGGNGGDGGSGGRPFGSWGEGGGGGSAFAGAGGARGPGGHGNTGQAAPGINGPIGDDIDGKVGPGGQLGLSCD